MASYNDMINKPKINGIEVSGSKELKDYNISPIMYDVETKYLYTILPDGMRVNIKSLSSLPSGYTQVDCIQSGNQQYIDTGITISGDLSFEIKFLSHDQYYWQNYGCIFGARQSSKSNEYQLTTYEDQYSTWEGTFRIAASNNDAKLNQQGLNTVIYDSNGDYYVNNVLKKNIAHPSFTYNQSIYLFALNNNGSVAQHGNVEIYYFKLYKSGVLIRNYLPCIRKSDNTPGMFDLVSNTFYGSATETPFIVPSA